MQVSNKQVSFGVSGSEIRKALTTGVDTNHAKNTICPGKANYLKSELLLKIEDIKDDVVIKLDDELNQCLPAESKLGKLFTWLNADSIFRCGGTDNCNCGKNVTNKKFLTQIFRQLGLDRPDILEIGR